MKTALVIVILLIAGLLTSRNDLSGCGPFTLTAVFTLSRQPDDPQGAFARGQLGILLPGFYRSHLVVAYRHLAGVGMSEAERAAFFPPPPAAAPVPTWVPEWKSSVPPSVLEWLEARKKVPGAGVTPKIDVNHVSLDSNNHFEYYVNCPDDAFHSATATLQARWAKFGAASAELKDWLSAQDTVFTNCASGSAIPNPAPSGSTPLLQADRAYQIAAAHFYSADFDQAQSLFGTIAADPNSPWRATSAYLVARCSIRKATLSNKPDSMLQARSELESILKDNTLKPVHAAAASLLEFVRARVEPERRLQELSKALLVKNAPASVARDLGDYLYLYSKRDARQKAPDDLTDWLEAFQTPVDPDHTLQRWRDTQSLPWLVAALTQVHAGDAAATELQLAADKVKPDSPAYPSVAFHAIRLLEESQQTSEARKRLDALLAARGNYPASSRNLFLAERMRIAESWEAFLKYAPRIPVGSGYDYELEGPSDLKDEPQLKKFAGGRQIFDADATTILNELKCLSGI